jgi:hypothetical protein
MGLAETFAVTTAASGEADQPGREAGSIAMARTHQPGESAFKSILPEDIEWTPFPPFRLRSVSPSSSVNPPHRVPT